MRSNNIKVCRQLYARLLRLYPCSHRARFGAGMAQTFADALSDPAYSGPLALRALHMLADTLLGVIHAHADEVALNTRRFLMVNRGIVFIVLATLTVLAIPFTAMRFTAAVQWTASDFAIMGALLFGTGLAYVLTAQHLRSSRQRLVLGAGFLGALLTAWACLAVGALGVASLPYLALYLSAMLFAIVGGLRPEPVRDLRDRVADWLG